MNIRPLIRTLFLTAAAILIVTVNGPGQDLTFSSQFSFEPAMIDTAPSLGGLDIKYPNEAAKNGVEGTVKLTMTLGEDGRVREIVIVEDLPHGVGAAVKAAFEKLQFTPASFEGKPVPIAASFTYKITAVYNEYDSNVTKVKLLGKPTAEYPAMHRADRREGKVDVAVVFFTDGKVKVVKVQSTMPKEFDQAASTAAEKLTFQPAMHKKSKRPVTQVMWVAFEFKP